jgi:glucose-1-phosphate thymidylyltransferase
MKGIILAGGRGSRLHPVTLSTCKQLLPVYDKPMIYYPLSVLMLAGIREILIISTPEDLPRFETLFGNGSQIGLKISYAVQPRPEGIAQAFLIGEEFIDGGQVALILGDNIFYGDGLAPVLQSCKSLKQGAVVFGYEVKDPQRYGVIEFDEHQRIKAIVEKPAIPPSSYAVTGLYFYDHQVVDLVRTLKPSARGELEITDLNQAYLNRGELAVHLLERGFAWLDTGTHDALWRASAYVQAIQERQGIQVGCIEEMAYLQGYIDVEQLERLGRALSSSEYGIYLQECAQKFSRDLTLR